MKKTFLFALISIAVLSLCACGVGNFNNDPPQSSNSTTAPINTMPSRESDAAEPAQNTKYLLTQRRAHDANGDYLASTVYEYEMSGNLLIKYEYYHNKDADKKLVQESRYDTTGNLLIEYSIDDNGKHDAWVEYTYDENGICRSEDRFSAEGIPVQSFVYNGHGDLSEYREYKKSGDLTTYGEDIYDGNQFKILSTTYNDDGTVWFWSMYSHYDESGNILSDSVDENLIDGRDAGTRVEYTYDSGGNILREITYQDTGGIIQTASTYDSWGNKLSSIVASQQNSVSLSWEYEYDASGRILSETRYVDGEMTEQIFRSYDVFGNTLSEEKHVPIDEKLGYRYEYIYEDIEIAAEETIL